MSIVAAATLEVERAGERQRIRWSHAWPVVLRPTGEEQVHLVHGAGGPLGGDRLALDVRVGAAARLTVRSAGATLVQPGLVDAPARWDTRIAVAPGATLDWAPEPTIVTDGATLHATLRADLAAGAGAVVREVVVLGRHGCRGGSYRGALHVSVGGTPLLAHTTLLAGTDPELGGPGGTAGARAVGTVVVAGGDDAPLPVGAGGGERAGVRWAWSPLAGPGALMIAVGEPAAVVALVSAASPRTRDRVAV